jgi:hypothetical protein
MGNVTGGRGLRSGTIAELDSSRYWPSVLEYGSRTYCTRIAILIAIARPLAVEIALRTLGGTRRVDVCVAAPAGARPLARSTSMWVGTYLFFRARYWGASCERNCISSPAGGSTIWQQSNQRRLAVEIALRTLGGTRRVDVCVAAPAGARDLDVCGNVFRFL